MTGPGDRWLLAWAVAYGLTHHLGPLPDGLGAAGGGTRWTDWLDLLVPYLVIGTALAALAVVGTDTRGWVAAAVATVLYAQGHGMHLAVAQLVAAALILSIAGVFFDVAPSRRSRWSPHRWPPC